MGGGIETWFYSNFLTNILAIQSSFLAHNELLVESMENWSTEFVTVSPDSPVTGVQSSPYMASATTFSFQLNRDLRTTRNGRKSYGGIPELLVDYNTATSTALGFINDICSDLVRGWTITDTGSSTSFDITPVIAKTPTPPATLPTVYNRVIGATFRGVGSQNTRKRLI
jgi:hypothetical protein